MTPGIVKAMSFNIRLSRANDGPDRWDERKQAVAEMIRRFGGDFVGIQEAWPEQIEYLRSQLPQYEFLARTRDDNPEWGEAVPLAWQRERWRLDPQEHDTFWLSDTPDVPGSKTFGNSLPRIVTWGRFVEEGSKRGVYVYNTHFSHVSDSARRQSAALLARRIAARARPDTVIALGDLNAGEWSDTVRHLTGQTPDAPVRLVDTFRALHPDAQLVGTLHCFQGVRSGQKIDYVLATPDATVLEARILYDEENGRYPSDHYPVTATLQLPAFAEA
jgi:endonuclease/exonuclease/phosphatase family metal-dependent hydrolase